MPHINPDRILYQDEHFLAVHKLSGELVVRGKGRVDKLPLLDFLRKDFPGVHPVNRLDFETSGIVIFARTRPALAKTLEGKFAGWTKTYRALVAGRIPKDTGEIRLQLPSRVKGEPVAAVTRYKVLERFGNSSYVETEIETGRHHQIRRHFRMIEHPLVLDSEYGNKKYNTVFTKEFGYRRFFLHAFAVTFPHPFTGQTVRIESPMPPTFLDILKRLKAAGEEDPRMGRRHAPR